MQNTRGRYVNSSICTSTHHLVYKRINLYGNTSNLFSKTWVGVVILVINYIRCYSYVWFSCRIYSLHHNNSCFKNIINCRCSLFLLRHLMIDRFYHVAFVLFYSKKKTFPYIWCKCLKILQNDEKIFKRLNFQGDSTVMKHTSWTEAFAIFFVFVGKFSTDKRSKYVDQRESVTIVPSCHWFYLS